MREALEFADTLQGRVLAYDIRVGNEPDPTFSWKPPEGTLRAVPVDNVLD